MCDLLSQRCLQVSRCSEVGVVLWMTALSVLQVSLHSGIYSGIRMMSAGLSTAIVDYSAFSLLSVTSTSSYLSG